MKKVFCLIALVAAMIVPVHAQSPRTATEAAFVNKFVKDLDEAMGTVSNDDMAYVNTTVEGKNIYCNLLVFEEQLGGLSFREVFQMVGVTEEQLGQSMREDMYSEKLNEEEYKGLKIFHSYGYKIYLRLIGSVTGEQMDSRIDYEILLQ
jgi:hypothetical protein